MTIEISDKADCQSTEYEQGKKGNNEGSIQHGNKILHIHKPSHTTSK